jgi:predicted RNA binding protein YcfA (HicA-like mRNA interferase family)
VKPLQLLRRCARGDVAGVRFADLHRLLVALGFGLQRTSGSHRIYAHPLIPEQINIQEVDGQAKPYQVRQLMRLVERYALNLEIES